MLFDLSLLILSAIAIKWAYNKDKTNKNKQILKAKKERLHKQFLQTKKWAEEI